MKPLVSTQLPTEFGPFEVHAFDSGSVNQPHLMLCSKKKATKHPLVRVHSECWTGDVAIVALNWMRLSHKWPKRAEL